MGLATNGGLTGGVGRLCCWWSSREDRMSDIPRIVSAETVIHGILKIEWNDGYVGVVDLWPVISRGKIFTYLQDARNFQKFHVGEYGHALIWINENGEEIDVGAGSLRQRAEKQSELHRQAG
jgi:hypothetical protein